MRLISSLAVLLPVLLVSCGGSNKELSAENDQLKKEVAKLKRESSAASAKSKSAQSRIEELEAALYAEEARSTELQLKLTTSESAARQIAATTEQTASTAAEAPSASMPRTSRSTAVQNEEPREMTDEEKLAAYISGGIQGVPFNIAQEIIKKARTEGSTWRIVSEIQSEGEGYVAFDTFSRTYTTMPTAIRDAIVAAAKREDAGDWSAMAREAKEEAEAWGTVEEWKRSGIPGVTRQRSTAILNEALERYPGDWTMVRFVAKEDAKKAQ